MGRCRDGKDEWRPLRSYNFTNSQKVKWKSDEKTTNVERCSGKHEVSRNHNWRGGRWGELEHVAHVVFRPSCNLFCLHSLSLSLSPSTIGYSPTQPTGLTVCYNSNVCVYYISIHKYACILSVGIFMGAPLFGWKKRKRTRMQNLPLFASDDDDDMGS